MNACRYAVRPGMNMLEICIAVAVMALAMIPIYNHISRQTSIAIHTEKIQMADKILQSIKEEMVGTPFKTLVELTKQLTKDAEGKYPLADGFYQATNQKVLEIQKKFKDFQVEGKMWFVDRRTDPNAAEVLDCIQVDAKVFWHFPGNEASNGVAKAERTRTFMIVAPK